MRPSTVVAALLLTACTCGGEDRPADADASPLDRTPGAIPAGWLMELSVGPRALAAVRAGAPERLRSALPAHAGDVLDAWVPVPVAIGDHLAPGSPVRCVHMLQGDDEVTACAARVGPLPDTLLRDPSGPRGSVWLADRTSESAVALAGDVIVAARTTDAVAEALPYLAFDAIERPVDPAEIHARIADGALGGRFREALERAIAQRAAVFSSSAGALGDLPVERDALIALARDAALGAVGFLPDLGEIEVVLASTGHGLVLRLRAEVTDRSPLAGALDVGPSPPGIERAPASSVIAWSSGAGAREPEPIVARVTALAGERADAGERAAIEGAVREWVAARGEGSLGAIALGARAPYLTLSSECRRPLDRRAVAAALGGSWARAVGALAGCEAGDRGCPRLGGEACALVIHADREAPAAGALGAEPAVARELSEAPPHAIARAVLVPSRAPALVPGAARDPGAAEPVVLTIGRDGVALVIELRATAAALDALARVIGG